ncbi:hypothetical protein [Sphingobacterium bambusae]|uniref:Uncharacterized protein n=1 Tax=Sphingobacterium bambusae TaxID=662858 RepID=A0ABW6BEU9_9SPHI|nr:hypothetical protein [Sphingobacterium bambusae]WPL47141.1 hypothetical protein SCB77_14330 [Sphingobacterium bambusae]
MIRPLIYCETRAHFKTSIETIDIRIQELLDLRQQYLAAQEANIALADFNVKQKQDLESIEASYKQTQSA